MKSTSPSFESLRMTLAVYESIRSSIGMISAETGGMLGGNPRKGEITHYFYDRAASRSAATYSPDTETTNRLLADQWNPMGVRLLGFVHSHPFGIGRPSHGDETYAERILRHNTELPFLALPIVQSEADRGQFQIRMFLARRDGAGIKIGRVPLIIVGDDDERCGYADQSPVPAADAIDRYPPGKTPSRSPEPLRRNSIREDETAPPADSGNTTFQRVQTAYDLQHLATCRVIYIGIGGAAGFAEDNARAGVGEHIIIDPDVVSETNLATQQVYRRDIGRPKAECVAERIIDINPTASVVAHQKSLEKLTDAAFRELAFARLPGHTAPTDVLLCGLTDNFEAQARVNRLGLNFGLPTLCAQVYKEGRGAEVTFAYPGVTPACHRCILSGRYAAYLKNGFHNDVTSDGTPIFATTRLNAIKGFIAMAILHHERTHPRWGRLLARIGNRNLVQVRLDPDIGANIGVRNFEEALAGTNREQLLFDETIWRPQLQECPATGYAIACPDCGGTGDLRFAIASFVDTRPMCGSNRKFIGSP